jgi:kinesin family protein 2/24
MMGCHPDQPAEVAQNAGLYVLAARDIFAKLALPRHRHLSLYVSCFEIYGGKLFDLLNDRNAVKCLEDAKQQVQLPGLSEHHVRDVSELLTHMARAHTQRSTGSTGANLESSRSHQVMQLVLREKVAGNAPVALGPSAAGRRKVVAPAQPKTIGKLSFIDLAGSERGADTTHSSKQTRMEGAEINTSLLALKEVIRSLEKKQGGLLG